MRPGLRTGRTSTDGRWVAMTRWMPAARASWVMRTTASSTSRGATIGDFDNHALVIMRDDHFCADWVKPRGCGETVGIEALAISHQLAAVVFSVPGSLVGSPAIYAQE